VGLQTYRAMLDRYHAIIFGEPWQDGRRDALVRDMDRVWAAMTSGERQAALAYAGELYRRRIA
jgi:hypothetical protein